MVMSESGWTQCSDSRARGVSGAAFHPFCRPPSSGWCHLNDRPLRCPQCGSSSVARILWGLPAFSDDLQRWLDEGEVVLGGCCLPDALPAWHCNRCQHRWPTPADEGTRMPASPPQTLSQRWLWVTTPEYYAAEGGSDPDFLDPAQPDAGGWWTCHRDTRQGDLVLLYRTRPRSDLGYLIQAESDAYSIADDEHAAAKQWDYACDYRVLHRFDAPLTRRDLQADPYLEDWGALRANFRRRVYRITDDVWHRLVRRITEREPAAGPLLRAGPLPPLDIPDEKAIEDRIAADPAILRPFGYDLEVRGRQHVCQGDGGRIDLLCYDRGRKRYVVIELKNVRAGRNTFGQIASYLGWAGRRLAKGRPVDGLVIARGFDHGFVAAASTNPRIGYISLADLGLA